MGYLPRLLDLVIRDMDCLNKTWALGLRSLVKKSEIHLVRTCKGKSRSVSSRRSLVEISPIVRLAPSTK